MLGEKAIYIRIMFSEYFLAKGKESGQKDQCKTKTNLFPIFGTWEWV